MRYERLQVFGAFLSISSALLSVGAILSSEIVSKSYGGLLPHLAWAASLLGAIVAASTSLILSRRLRRTREERNRVFIIYAREDLEKAQWLSDELRKRGFLPWLDVNEIALGEVWRKSVLRALEESTLALVLVSEHLEKKSFAQDEIRVALSTLQERQQGFGPVIPVRLSDVPVPKALRDVQWVNLFDADGLEKLEKGLSQITA